MRSWSTHALRRTLSRAGSSGANDHPPAPHSQAGGRLPQSPPLRQGLGTLCDNDRGSWTRGEGSAYTPPGLVVSCGVGISVVSVREVVLIPHQQLNVATIPCYVLYRVWAGGSHKK